jgi:type I restriction enzyme S subunit
MMARLGDYIEQIRGVSYKPEDICSLTDNDAVAILRANNIQDDGLNFDDLIYVKKNKVSLKHYL